MGERLSQVAFVLGVLHHAILNVDERKHTNEGLSYVPALSKACDLADREASNVVRKGRRGGNNIAVGVVRRSWVFSGRS